jgi:hypothetical protein
MESQNRWVNIQKLLPLISLLLPKRHFTRPGSMSVRRIVPLFE